MLKRTDLPSDCFEETASLGGFEKAKQGYWYQFIHEKECLDITSNSWKELARINELAKTEESKALEELKIFVKGIDKSARIVFPFMLDYPSQIEIGEGTFINMGFLHLSAGFVKIGKNCFIGPNCHLYTPNHHISDVKLRREGWQYDLPITIGDDVWLGGDVTVVPGVEIGNNVVIGAGSVVTKNVPSNCRVAGNPARII